MSYVRNEKAEQFIIRLMANPALQGMHPLKKEQQLLHFLKVNGPQLFPTLSSPAFFPGKEKNEIDAILLGELRFLTDQKVVPSLKNFFNNSMRPAALISGVRNPDLETIKVREGLCNLLTSLLSSSDGREALIPGLTLFESPLLGKYIPQIVRRQKYISFEIRMVQRFKEVPENIIDYLKMTILLKPIIHTFLENTGELINGCVSPGYGNRVIRTLEERFPQVPGEIIKGLIHSSISFLDDRELLATSRLSAIFTQRAVNWNPVMKIDRGAESSDKSWFNIARKNYRFYGYDVDMLMELYNIAAEMGW